MKAHCLIRPQPCYRREAFVAGLRAAGHEVVDGIPRAPGPDTLLLTWNRYNEGHALACRVEAAGGVVICAENGYLGRGGTVPKWDVYPAGPRDGDFYALAVGGHNGSGSWPDGDGSRWAALQVELQPWRASGEHVLVCPSRSFGRPGAIMPTDWAQQAVTRLRELTDRPVRERSHPGNDEPQRPLRADLEGCWAVCIWASSAGVHALVAGIPVLCDAPYWVAKGAAGTLEQVADPPMDDGARLAALRRMAWAQCSVEEIASGEPFRRLLRGVAQAEVAAGA